MSTRSQLGFYRKEPAKATLKKWEALIYRHSDGYPDAVLPDIIPFLKWWKSKRGITDLEYCSARLLQYLCNEYDNHSKEFEKKIGKTALSNDGDYTGIYGHGICKAFHGDIEYYYAIYPNKVQIYSVGFDKKEKDWKLLITIDLDKEFKIEDILKEIEKKEV
jgi:hypothetical protein